MRFDLLLDMVHHCYRSNQNDGRDYLMRVKTGVEETPGDADCGEGLHHFKVPRCRCPGEMEPLEINQQRDPT